MILLTAVTLASVQIDTAYYAGRCSPWMTSLTREETLRSMNAIDPRLRTTFDEGERDSNKQPLHYETCSRLMNRAANELARASNAIRNPAR